MHYALKAMRYIFFRLLLIILFVLFFENNKLEQYFYKDDGNDDSDVDWNKHGRYYATLMTSSVCTMTQ